MADAELPIGGELMERLVKSAFRQMLPTMMISSPEAVERVGEALRATGHLRSTPETFRVLARAALLEVSQLMLEGLERQGIKGEENDCPYTFAHTRHWCGRPGCRES